MKKKTKNKLIKGSLCLLTCFLFIFAAHYERDLETNPKLATISNNNLVFKFLTKEDIINILENKKGVILLTNNKKDINKYIDILYKSNIKKDIYVYNLKHDEIILNIDKNDNITIKQRPSELYKDLINHLGLFTESYLLEDSSGNLIETEYKKIYTPLVMFINKGKIIYSHFNYEDNLSEEELINEYKIGYEMLKEYNL